MLPLMGLVMAMALMGGVFSVDMGLIYNGREAARMAADMAALAGVQELPASEVEARAKALEYAALNGFDDCSDGDQGAPGCDPNVTVTATVMTGPNYDPIACLREGYCLNVTVTRQWQWLFGGLLHLPPVTITASSVSQLGGQPRDVMVVLDTSGSMCDDLGRGSPGYCKDASKASLVGLDMTSGNNSINFNAALSTLGGLNVPFVLPPGAPGATTYSFTINGVPFTYTGASTLNSIVAAINAVSGATSVTASLSNTNNNATLTLTKTLFGVAPTITIDDVEPGNFFRATRMLGDPQPTKLSGNDVDSALNTINYPADLGVPLMNLNSISANFDVDFVAAPAGQFCIKASGHISPEGDPCTAVNGTVINYNPAVDSMNAVLARINSTAAAGVCATFAGDVFTLTRATAGCIPALGPIPLTVSDLNGNFFQAVKVLQVPTYSTAVGMDIADCVGPPSGSNSDTCFDTNDLGGPPDNAKLSDLNDELAVDLVPGAASFVINGCTIAYNTSESMNTITARIGTVTAGACSAGSGGPVTATVQVGSDTFLLASTTLGDQPITYNDVVTNNGIGNFLQSMKFITPIRRTTLVGLDVEGSLGTGFDASDLTAQLRDLDSELQVDIERGSGFQFCINATGNPCIGGGGNNGVLISYNAPVSGTGDTLQTILDKINNPANATGVIASMDTTTHQLTLRRNAYGSTAITVADISGNFLHAMQILGGSYSRVTGLDVADCANDGSGNACDITTSGFGSSVSRVTDSLISLNKDLTVDIVSVANGQLEINGQPIFYNTATDSIQSVIDQINNPANATGVTASFVSSNSDPTTQDRFTLLANTPGAQPITFEDITGNFLQAMRLLSGGSKESITGGDVDTGASSFDNGDLTVTLPNLNDELDVDFQLTNPSQFMINDVVIPSFNPNTATLNSIKALIDGSAAGVTATYDTTADTLTLTRNAPGNDPITFADLAGNFFQAMKFYSGGTATVAVGANVDKVGGNVTTTNANLTTLNAQLAVPISKDGSFFINGKLISYTMGQTLATVLTNITNDPDALVTASFNAGGGLLQDQLVLTRKAPGNLDITFSDNVGNFLHAMQFVSGSPTEWVGLDVADCPNDGSGAACDINVAGGSGSDVAEALDTLNEDLTVDIRPTAAGRLTINGQGIDYDTSSDSINSVIGYINDPINSTGVFASFDTTTDKLTLRALDAGPAPIVIADVAGNFFQAMRLIAPTIYASITGLDIDTFGSTFDSSDLGAWLSPDLNGELDVDVQPTIPSQFSINGVALPQFDPSSTTLNDIKVMIDSSAADVIATFDTNADTMTLTRKTPGDLPITVVDNTGNFLQAMRLLLPATFESIEGLDVGSSFDSADSNNPLRDLNSGTASTFTVPFTLSNSPQTFSINGTTITYCARSASGTCTGGIAESTLDSIIAAIDGSAAGVTATLDFSADTITLTRTVAGPNPIVLADGSGNFLRAMQLIGAATFQSVTGLDVGSNFDSADSNNPLRDLNSGAASIFTVPFTLSNSVQSFSINGTTITYCARSSSGTCTGGVAESTLDSIIAAIDGSAAGVTVSVDYTADTMTLTRTVAGLNPITLEDGTGNFLRAMRFITQSGGAFSTVTGGNVGSLVNASPGTLSALDALLTVPFQHVSNGSFTVNGTTVTYNTLTDTFAAVLSRIGTTSGTDVTAAFADGTHRLTFTATNPGNTPITFADVDGNFMEAMGMATSTRVSLEGLDVDGAANTFDPADLPRELRDLNTNATLVTPFVITPSTQLPAEREFLINGVPITYTAPSAGAGSTLNSIVTAINASGAGVVATIDTNTDKLKLTRTASGPLAPITVSDVSGNFFQVMRFVSGGSRRTAVGVDVGDLSNANLSANMNTLTPAQLNRVFQTTGSFTIRGVTFNYNAGTDSILDILTAINASAAADVTATFDTGTDQLTVTRDTLGGAAPDLTFVDVSGNFLKAMGMIAGPATFTTAVGQDVGSSFDPADLNLTLAQLNNDANVTLDVDFVLANPMQFSINGATISFNPNTTTLNQVKALIDASAGADVTVTYDTGAADNMTLTRDTAGALPITFADISGNFMQAMRMLAPATSTSVVGLDLDASDGGGFSCVFNPNSCAFDPGDSGRQLRDLNATEAQFVVPFALSNTARSFTINGVSISYTAASSGSGSTLDSIVLAINGSAAGVTASIDYNSDAITLTRTVAGPNPITLADVAPGNFLAAMRLIPSGVQTLGTAPSAIATVTLGLTATGGATLSGSNTTASSIAAATAGSDPVFVSGTPGSDPSLTVIGVVTPGTNGTIIGTVTPGVAGGGLLPGVVVVVGANGLGAHLGVETAGVTSIPPAPADYNCQNLPGSDVVTVPGDVICGNPVVPSVTTVDGVDAVAVPVAMGTDAQVTPTPGVVPPLPLNNPCPAFTSQCRIAVVTPGLDASDIRGDLSLGDDIAIGHLIASFTLSNHRPLDVPPVDFWKPFGDVQRAASYFSRLPVFAPEFDQMGLVGFSDTAGVADLVKPPTDPIHECETAGVPIAGCLVPNLPLGHNFGAPPSGFSGFEQQLLELQAEGSTNTGAGLCVALNDLRTPALGHGQVGAEKIIVLLSDGAPTAAGQPGCPTIGTPVLPACAAYAQSGNVPSGQYEYTRYMACLAREASVVIHTIGFSLANATDTQLLRDVAAITGGQYFDAPTAGDLAQQFENVANVLGIALTR